MKSINLPKFEQQIPYNNFSFLLRDAGYEVPMEWGDHCFGRAQILGDVAKEIGLDVRYGMTECFGHIGVITERRGNLHYTDPSLAQITPIPLHNVLEDDGLEEVEAFPFVRGFPSRVCASSIGTGRFRIQKYIPWGDGGYIPAKNALGEVHFDYNVNDFKPEFPRNITRIMERSVPLREFVLRLIEEDGSETRLVRNKDAKGGFKLISSGGQGVIQRKLNRPQDRMYMLIRLVRIADSLGVEIDDLTSLMDMAAKLDKIAREITEL
ncbi:hypothetical protein HN748_01730 [Candidatus Peregrinibacteria bacterium]|nr:hypothetical protein [Candidatus Peregrinibacteria bacterium]